MRKLIFAINMTIDGCCDHTKGIATEEIHAYHTALLQQSDTLVFGRKTYELMVPFWPDIARNQSGETKDINEFAEAFTDIRDIVVFSNIQPIIVGEGRRLLEGVSLQSDLKLVGSKFFTCGSVALHYCKD